MKISIIVPVFNEEKTISTVLNRVINAPVLNYEKEIIVVNDGSADRTQEILNKLNLDFTLLNHDKNYGKGRALRTGFKKASGDIIIVQDGDLEYDPNDYEKLISLYQKTNCPIYGSRNINNQNRGYGHYVLGVKFLTWVNNLLFGSKLTDTYTCYKLFPTDLIKSVDLKSNGFEIEAEMTAKILKTGQGIKEVGISYNPRKFKQGKKIRPRDGLIGLWTILKIKFSK